ncbi:MAG: hypothetical protein QM578_12570 [Pantoea sp.]
MTQVTHGLTRDELVKRVFGKTKPSHWDSRTCKARDDRSFKVGNQKRGE